MHIVWHKIEVIVDGLIPPILAALLIIIVGELFFSQQLAWYKHYADLFDGFVVLIFAADLGFKYERIRKLPKFLKKYWLQVIATIPFFLVFRLLDFFNLADFIQKGQAFAHEEGVAATTAITIEKEVGAIAKEASKAGEISRTAKLLNTFRAIGRFPRMLNAAHFFEKPSGKHYFHEQTKKTKREKH